MTFQFNAYYPITLINLALFYSANIAKTSPVFYILIMILPFKASMPSASDRAYIGIYPKKEKRKKK